MLWLHDVAYYWANSSVSSNTDMKSYQRRTHTTSFYNTILPTGKRNRGKTLQRGVESSASPPFGMEVINDTVAFHHQTSPKNINQFPLCRLKINKQDALSCPMEVFIRLKWSPTTVRPHLCVNTTIRIISLRLRKCYIKFNNTSRCFGWSTGCPKEGLRFERRLTFFNSR